MNRSIGSFLLIMGAFLLTSCTRTVTNPAPAASKTCALNLQIFVRQGPTVDHTISGQVAFGRSMRSSFKGNFAAEDGSSHPVSLSLDGQALHFILDMEQGPIFGTGIMESDLATCTGNGGGTLSGPLLGDLGDWRGEWISKTVPIPSSTPGTARSGVDNLLSSCLYLPLIALGLFLAFFAYRLLALFKRTPSTKGQTSNPGLRRTNQGTRSEPGKDEKPLAEYLATYLANDQLFDLSFEIERSSHYLGECGIAVAKVADIKSNQAAALEIWLFDAKSAQTVSRILASNFCFSQENLRSGLEQKGQVSLIQPGETVTVETKGLRAQANILQVEYESTSPDPQSIFKKVVIRIGIWADPG